MKLAILFALFTISVMVKGNLIAVAQPVLLTLGTIFTAFNKSKNDEQLISWGYNIMPMGRPKKVLTAEEIAEKNELERRKGLEK